MSEPNTAPQKARPRRRGAVGVIVRRSRLLVIRRSQFVPAPLTYCFPGGGIEPHETDRQALVREIEEELAVTVEPVRQLWHSITSWGVELWWWLAHLPSQREPVPAPAEVASIHWCTLDEMAELPELLESNRQFLAALAAGEFQLDL